MNSMNFFFAYIVTVSISNFHTPTFAATSPYDTIIRRYLQCNNNNDDWTISSCKNECLVNGNIQQASNSSNCWYFPYENQNEANTYNCQCNGYSIKFGFPTCPENFFADVSTPEYFTSETFIVEVSPQQVVIDVDLQANEVLDFTTSSYTANSVTVLIESEGSMVEATDVYLQSYPIISDTGIVQAGESLNYRLRYAVPDSYVGSSIAVHVNFS
eukprot:Pgem_evm1s19472